MGRRRTNLAWLIAVIAGVFMVVPTLASAQEQGSTEAEPTLTDEVTADDSTTTEDPAAETPAAEAPPADPVVPAEPTEPAPVEEPTEPAESAGLEGSVDTSKAAAPETSSAPAPAPAAAPEPEPADVPAVEAEATDSPGNGGGGKATTATRLSADGGGEAKATVKSGESKPGCLARGGANEVHNTFPDDGSCETSIQGLGDEADGVSDLSLTLNGNTVTFDLWLTDSDGEGGPDTVNYTVLTGGPASGAFYVKGGPPHNQCTFTNVANGAGGSCSTALNPNSGKLYGFSHLDVCLGENPPPPPPPDITETPENPPLAGETPEDQDVLTEEQREQREQREEQREEQEELEEAVPPTAIPTAVTPAPEEALPFTGLDTGWLVLMSLGLLGSGVLLRRKVS